MYMTVLNVLQCSTLNVFERELKLVRNCPKPETERNQTFTEKNKMVSSNRILSESLTFLRIDHFSYSENVGTIVNFRVLDKERAFA